MPFSSFYLGLGQKEGVGWIVEIWLMAKSTRNLLPVFFFFSFSCLFSYLCSVETRIMVRSICTDTDTETCTSSSFSLQVQSVAGTLLQKLKACVIHIILLWNNSNVQHGWDLGVLCERQGRVYALSRPVRRTELPQNEDRQRNYELYRVKPSLIQEPNFCGV